MLVFLVAIVVFYAALIVADLALIFFELPRTLYTEFVARWVTLTIAALFAGIVLGVSFVLTAVASVVAVLWYIVSGAERNS